jgi:hypothetical protein
MVAVMARSGLSARAWAEKAKLGKDTVSRAVRDDYQHVTSTTTIAKLADAAGEPAFGAAGAVPSVASLVEILDVLHGALGTARPTPGVLQALAAALRDTLLHLADEPEAAVDPRLSRGLARASVRQSTRPHA